MLQVTSRDSDPSLTQTRARCGARGRGWKPGPPAFGSGASSKWSEEDDGTQYIYLFFILLPTNSILFSKRRTPNKHNDVTHGSVADLLGPAAPRPLVPLRVPQLGDDLPLVAPGAGTVRVQRRLQLAALLPCNTSDTDTLVMLRHLRYDATADSIQPKCCVFMQIGES